MKAPKTPPKEKPAKKTTASPVDADLRYVLNWLDKRKIPAGEKREISKRIYKLATLAAWFEQKAGDNMAGYIFSQ